MACFNCRSTINHNYNEDVCINISCCGRTPHMIYLCEDCIYSYERTIECENCCQYACCEQCCEYITELDNSAYVFESPYSPEDNIVSLYPYDIVKLIMEYADNYIYVHYTIYDTGYTYRIIENYDECELRNNGVIYIWDGLWGDGLYTISKNTKVIRHIYNTLCTNFMHSIIVLSGDLGYQVPYTDYCGGNMQFPYTYNKKIRYDGNKCYVHHIYEYDTESG